MAKIISVTSQQVWDILNSGRGLRVAAKQLGIAVTTAIRLRNEAPHLAKPTPINSHKKKPNPPVLLKGKGAPKSPILDPAIRALLEVPDITVPETVNKTSPKSLASGAYQRKLLAFFAPVLLPEVLNAIRRNVRVGDVQAQKLAADILGLTPKGGGINLFMNQQNVNQAKSEADSGRRVSGPTTPDEMFRLLAQEREQRRINAASGVIDLVATPSAEYEKDVLIQPE
jgi:hypothetical protein